MVNPDCRQVLAVISAYLDGELEDAVCDRIEQHCAACANCAAVVQDLRNTAGLCRRLGATPLPAAVLDRARASLHRLLEAPPKKEE